MRASARGRLHATLLWLHRYSGLLLGLPLFLLAVTGCVLVFEAAVDRRLNPHLLEVVPQSQRLPLQELVDRVRAAYPEETPLEIRLPRDSDRSGTVFLRSRHVVFFDPFTGEIKGDRLNLTAPMLPISRLHTGRVAGAAGQKAVGLLTAFAMFGVVSGLYLWWPRKIFTLKRAANWRRFNFDLHNVLGIWSAGVLFFTLVSGVMITWERDVERLLVRWIDGKAVEEEPRPQSTPVADGYQLTLDETVAIADGALPGTSLVGINILPPGKGAYQVLLHYPEDKTGAGRSRVFVDQFTGKVLRVVSSRELPIGTQIVNFIEPIHTGIVLGWPTMVLAFLGTAALAGQSITGFAIWWKPNRPGAASRSAKQR